jgi:hypothetical protein
VQLQSSMDVECNLTWNAVTRDGLLMAPHAPGWSYLVDLVSGAHLQNTTSTGTERPTSMMSVDGSAFFPSHANTVGGSREGGRDMDMDMTMEVRLTWTVLSIVDYRCCGGD